MINILLAKANLNIYNFPRHGEWKMDENVCFFTVCIAVSF